MESVLRSLLERHPDLIDEVNEIAKSYISDADAESVAADVEYLVSSTDVDELYDRSGDHSWGYIDIGDAAGEMLDEELKSVFDDLDHNIDLGFKQTALEICAGIVLGLYTARKNDSEGVLGWAPDYLAEAACRAVSRLVERPEGTGWRLPEGFIEQVPDWREMLGRVQAKRPRAGAKPAQKVSEKHH